MSMPRQVTIQRPKATATGYFSLYPKDSADQVRWGVRSYLAAVTGKIPGTTTEDLDVFATDYLAAGKLEGPEFFKEDIERYYVSIRAAPPKTIYAKLSYAKIFLQRNGIDFGPMWWKDLYRKIKGKRAVTVDGVPTNEELRGILSHLPILGRTIVLTAESSGARIGELLKAALDDLDMKSDPVRLTIRSETSKSGGMRVVFLSREAREALQEWLHVRSTWLASAVKKTTVTPLRSGGSMHVTKDGSDRRLFPVSHVTIHEMYSLALSKAGILKRDPRTGVATFHFHVLRKLFRTRLAPILNQDIIEALMGHEAYLSEAYRRYTLDQLAEFYRKGEPALWVLSEAGEASLKVDQTREALQEQLRVQGDRIKALESTLLRKLRDLNRVPRKQEKDGPLASRWRSQES